MCIEESIFLITLYIIVIYDYLRKLMHPDSSLPSLQSTKVLHTEDLDMHSPLLQRNWIPEHIPVHVSTEHNNCNSNDIKLIIIMSINFIS